MFKRLTRLSRRRLRGIPRPRRAQMAAATGLALMALWPADAAATTLSDGAFNSGDWALTVYKSNTGFVTQTTLSFGGNPGAFSNVYVLVDQPPAPAKVLGVQIYQPQAYSPATSGAFGAINFKMDYTCSNTSCVGVGQLFGLALHQGGNDYITGDINGYPVGANSGPFDNHWHSMTSTWTASQFCLVSNATIAGSSSASCAPNQHPDFSATGAPIKCGFYSYDDQNGGAPNYTSGPYSWVHTEYDNWSCSFLQTGSFSVTKIVGPDPLGIGSTMVFAITASCGSRANTYLINAHGNTSTIATGNVPWSSQCLFSESHLPVLPPGCVWLTPRFSPQPLIIGTATNETVTNGYQCRTGSLSLTKTFVDATGSPIAIGPLNFNVSVSCTTAIPAANLLLVTGATNTTSSSPAGVVANIPPNDLCTPTETYPPMSPQEKRACETDGAAGTPYWDTTYTPTLPITIAAGSNAATVTNTLRCKGSRQAASLSVTKMVSPDPLGIGQGMVFPITATCTNPSNVYSWNAHDNASTVPISVPYANSCQFSESHMPALPRGCTWLPPQYSPQPMTAASGLNQEVVKNSYTCGPPCPGCAIQQTPAPPTTCPKGQELVDGACAKNKSGLEGIFGHATFGVGAGSGGHEGGKNDGPTPGTGH